MAKVSLSVAVKDDYLDRFSDVAEDCRKAGLKVEEELEQIGVITGTIDAAKADALKKVRGVAHVEESHDYQLPPPESEIQ